MDASTFLIAVAQIIMIDILLGGDNAVVIALACRRLPEAQRPPILELSLHDGGRAPFAPWTGKS